jgi:nitrate/nitrite transport system substrate-binding protein
MTEAGLTPPAAMSKTFVIMGKTFDPGKPDDYIKSFKIKKAV